MSIAEGMFLSPRACIAQNARSAAMAAHWNLGIFRGFFFLHDNLRAGNSLQHATRNTQPANPQQNKHLSAGRVAATRCTFQRVTV